MPTREENLIRMQELYDSLEVKPKGIKIGCETVIEPEKFWKAHMSVVKNIGKEVAQPYYDRMVKWMRIVIERQKENESE